VTSRPSRRAFLAGTVALGASAGAASVALGKTPWSDSGVATQGSSVPFHGDHQSGIVTPAQDRLFFAAFDVINPDRAPLIEMLKAWTLAAEVMMAGRSVGDTGAVDGPYDLPPEDTGEALDLDPARLSITFGFGPSLFEGERGEQLGLTKRRPAQLTALPHFPGDKLDPSRSDGDICIQACADDPQVAVHAIRNLARIGFGTVAMRWSQLGFGRTSSTSTSQVTPRNLFGFKDGTANLKAEESPETLQEFVWVHTDDEPEWFQGGTYLVARRISMHIETWDRTSLREQEAIVGRTKGTGAPLSGGSEFDPVNFERTGRGDQALVPMNAHVRLAHPAQNEGVRLLRRGYNFADGSTSLGRIDAGLFFIAFVRRPFDQFVPMQTKLSREDGLMEYLQHTGSGLWAVPPGLSSSDRPDRFIGDSLFG
jgi:deferrochelatase/peroxidase EfeB